METQKLPNVPPYYPKLLHEDVPFLVYPRDGFPRENCEKLQHATFIDPLEGTVNITSNGSSSEVRARIERYGQVVKNSAEKGVYPGFRDLSCVCGLMPVAVIKHIVRQCCGKFGFVLRYSLLQIRCFSSLAGFCEATDK